MPPRETITVTQVCPTCDAELGAISENKENLMLSLRDEMWCESCQSTVAAVRDISGRRASIDREIESYPRTAELEAVATADSAAG